MSASVSPPPYIIREGQGPPIVLVHGLFGSRHLWRTLIPTLVSAGFEVIAPDLLGHGSSPIQPGPAGYHADSVFKHFRDWLYSLDLEQPPLLIGHSLGAYMTLSAALESEITFAGLFFANPFFSKEQLPEAIRHALDNTSAGKAFFRFTPHWIIRSALRLGEANGERFPFPIRDRIARDFKELDPEVFDLALTLTNLIPDLPLIRLPTMVVWGEKDQLLAPESFRDICALIPNAIGGPLPGGHNPHLSHPKTFNQAVLTFASSLFSRRSREGV